MCRGAARDTAENRKDASERHDRHGPVRLLDRALGTTVGREKEERSDPGPADHPDHYSSYK